MIERNFRFPQSHLKRWVIGLLNGSILQLFALSALACAPAQELNSKESAEQENVQGSYDAAKQSLGWMTRSLQQMADKLDSISSKLDPNASEEEINREVKRAMREAFADFLPGNVIQNAGAISAGTTQVDSQPRTFDAPIWDPKTPSWVKDRVVDKEVVRIAVESAVESSAHECEVGLEQQLPELVRKVLDEHVLKHAKASEINRLTPQYLTSTLVKPNTQYELVLDRPSGTYYQLFRLVHIGPDQINEIRNWERDYVTTKRVQWLSGSALSVLMLLATASGITGMIAKRSNELKR